MNAYNFLGWLNATFLPAVGEDEKLRRRPDGDCHAREVIRSEMMYKNNKKVAL